jgi:ribosome biogenesis GTPase
MTEATCAGRVVIAYGRDSLVETEDGTLVRCHHRRRLGRPVCGDFVQWLPSSPGEGSLETIEPRRTLVERGDFRGRPRPTAANVDRMVVVVAPKPGVDRTLIDRYLVLAAHMGIQPALFLNKVDMLKAGEREALLADVRLYPDLDCPVLAGSAETGEGLNALREFLAGHTGILVGQSGVGKSSLINALIPDLELRIGALSEASGHGRHTTTETTLFHLPDGGELIDSPGIRTLRLDHLPREVIVAGYPEIAQWVDRCRFADCRHETEPGCAVRKALDEGLIETRRLESLRTLLAEG